MPKTGKKKSTSYRYSRDEKLSILAVYEQNGRNLRKTVRECGVSMNALREWVKDSTLMYDPILDQARAAAMEEFEVTLKFTAHKALDRARELLETESDLDKVTKCLKVLIEVSNDQQIQDIISNQLARFHASQAETEAQNFAGSHRAS